MTRPLQRRLEEIESRLRYLEEQFPGWRLWGSGYGPGNEPPAYYAEIRRLEEEREAVVLRLSKRGKLKGHAETDVAQAQDRRAMVNAYIEEVLRKTGKRITRTDIWKKAGYRTRTEFERWERRDAKHPNNAAHQNFMRILTNKPHLE